MVGAPGLDFKTRGSKALKTRNFGVTPLDGLAIDKVSCRNAPS
jgi:hypothetical protein